MKEFMIQVFLFLVNALLFAAFTIVTLSTGIRAVLVHGFLSNYGAIYIVSAIFTGYFLLMTEACDKYEAR